MNLGYKLITESDFEKLLTEIQEKQEKKTQEVNNDL